MDYVIDFIGYTIATGKTQKLDFFIKEFCIVRVKGNKVYQPVHHIVKPPFSWRKLSDYIQNQYTELIRKIHGLDWADGDVSIEEAREIISSKLGKARSIYVLRETQIRDLNIFTGTNYFITSLYQLGFKLPENIVSVKIKHNDTMSHNVVKTAMFTAHLLSRQRLPLTKGSLRRNMQKMHLKDHEIKKINEQIRSFFKKSLSTSMIKCKIINQPNGRMRVEIKSYVNSKFRYKNWVDMDNNENYPNMHFRIIRNKFSIPKAYLVSADASGEKFELIEIVRLLDKKLDYEIEYMKKFDDVSDASSELDKVEGINPGRISPIDNDDNDWAISGSNHWMKFEEDANYESDSSVDEFRQLKETNSGNEGPDVNSEIDIDYNGWASLDDIKKEPISRIWSPEVNRSPESHKSPVGLQSLDNRIKLENNQVNPNAIIVDSDSDVDRVYKHKKLRGAMLRLRSLQSDYDADFTLYVESDPIQLIRDDNSAESDVIIVDDDSPRAMDDNFDGEDWAIDDKGK
ncbi:hypothetical protein KQX54_014303 [Cotesia glomerata]|uniref:Uncharacterized protein n=1 Tax=Cotesia glomerata TaxID=32391 RepID=A0AAV7IN31_COTGL|nr:hypothetical protein KQX54_014303 [Cotesia glomerata]